MDGELAKGALCEAHLKKPGHPRFARWCRTRGPCPCLNLNGLEPDIAGQPSPQAILADRFRSSDQPDAAMRPKMKRPGKPPGLRMITCFLRCQYIRGQREAATFDYADCRLQADILPDFASRSRSKPIFWPSTSSRIPARSTAEI